MAVVHDATSTLGTGTGTRSWNHTPVGTPAGVVVVISGGAVDETSGVAYGTTSGTGGTAMSREYTAANTGGESGTTSCWYLNSPGSGVKEITISRSGSTAYIACAFTVTSATGATLVLTGDQYTSTGTSSAGFTLTLDSTASFIAGGIYSGENSLSSITANPTNFSTEVEQDFGNFVSRLGRINAINTGASQDFTFTQSSDDAAVAAIAIKEAAASVSANAGAATGAGAAAASSESVKAGGTGTGTSTGAALAPTARPGKSVTATTATGSGAANADTAKVWAGGTGTGAGTGASPQAWAALAVLLGVSDAVGAALDATADIVTGTITFDAGTATGTGQAIAIHAALAAALGYAQGRSA